MLRFRPFRNTDPPILADIWRSRGQQRGFLQAVSADVFEQLVFSKPYFDPQGLILAWDDSRPVGFAHAGFGPGEHGRSVSTDLGVVCLLITRPDCDETAVGSGLLESCEAYLAQRGATIVYGGGLRPLNPFYTGLYGGSELAGVLKSDKLAQALFQQGAYQEVDRVLIFRGDMREFQAPIDRQQLVLRRNMIVRTIVDPRPRTWWDACTMGDFDLTRFEIAPRVGGPSVGHLTVRSMDPLGLPNPARTSGVVEMFVEPAHRRKGYTKFMLTEAFRHLIRQDIHIVEAHTLQHNVATVALFKKLGFQLADEGTIFRKEHTANGAAHS